MINADTAKVPKWHKSVKKKKNRHRCRQRIETGIEKRKIERDTDRLRYDGVRGKRGGRVRACV